MDFLHGFPYGSSMRFFDYRNDRLFAEDVDLSRMARDLQTPFYCYSSAAIMRQYRVFRAAMGPLDAEVFYALKANSNQAVLTLLRQEGAGFDIVSQGELKRVLAAGADPGRITFSGVGKTGEEIAAALAAGVSFFNVESEPELEAVSHIAAARGQIAHIALRVNPDVDAKTHAKISTGKSENKFGVPISRALEVYDRARSLPGLAVHGVDMHIGSQIVDLTAFDDAFALLADFVGALRARGHVIRHLDIGGGLGVSYRRDEDASAFSPERYAAVVKKNLGALGCKLIFEPGRFIVANAGILVCSVIYVKEAENKRFVIVDGAMNDLIRPTLYEAHHEILPLLRKEGGNSTKIVADVVGPVCETGDYLALDREIALPTPGDHLAILSAGAYGAVQSSVYNSRLLAPEAMVKGGQWRIIRARTTYEDLIALDTIPTWSQP